MAPLRDDTVVLRDGRRLAYAEWGDAEGADVFLFHGNPGSRLYSPDPPATAAAHVRLLTLDRPGVGRSDVLPRRTFADWPRDVIEVADALGIDRFGIVGWSKGGPYAAACAALIADRLTGVGIGACRALSTFNFVENPVALEELAADDRRLLSLARQDPDAAALAVDREWVRTLWESPDRWFDDARIPEVDQEYFEDPERRRVFLEAMREGVRQGPDAFAWEEIDVFLPWGFRLADIDIEVAVFHGEQDTWVARRHVDFLVATLPRARLTAWADAGHNAASHWREILEAVT